MARPILILTEPGDTHAYAVAEALKRKKAEVILWHTTDFPSRASESIVFENGKKKIILHGLGLELEGSNFKTIWHRRPSYVLDEAILHPADQKFADLECNVFRRSLFSLLERDAFWVNPPDAATYASRKPVQQEAALSVGLTIPDSIYTNDPEEIREFIARHGGEIIYKPFRAVTWKDKDTYWIPYTSALRVESLVEDNFLRLVPGIYQELVPKSYELRVTVIGRQVLAAKIDSQATQTGRLDWRKSYHELNMESYKIPPCLAKCCISMLNRLGLVFGCFDFIVTPEGKYVFLEVNEMGQFLFLEHYAGLPLLDAFSEFLIQASPSFDWSPDRDDNLKLTDIEDTVRAMAEIFIQRHTARPDSAIWEGS